MQVASNVTPNAYRNGGGGNNLPKKLALSISLVLAAALELSANLSQEQQNQVSNCNTATHALQVLTGTNGVTQVFCNDLKRYSGGRLWTTLDNYDVKLDMTMPSKKNMGLDYRLRDNHQVGDVIHNTNGNPSGWVHLKNGGSGITGNNATINSLTIKGDTTRFEINNTGHTTITTINNDGLQLNLRNTNLTVTTLNQNSSYTPPDSNVNTAIFQNVSVITLNVNAGSAANNGGTITNANINGGEFKQTNGSITTLNQSGGQATQTGGTITTANLSGGVFTHKGGTLSNVVLKAGGSGSTFVNGTSFKHDIAKCAAYGRKLHRRLAVVIVPPVWVACPPDWLRVVIEPFVCFPPLIFA